MKNESASEINLKRVRKMNSEGVFEHIDSTEFFDESGIKKDGTVVYWMNREMCAENNWSILFAQEIANKTNQKLVVVYNLVTGFLGGQNRQLSFKIEGLKNVAEKLAKKNIPFYVLIEEDGKKSAEQIFNFCHKNDVNDLVTDFYPLNLPKKWNQQIFELVKNEYGDTFAHKINFYEVDAHNIVPATIVSDKQEYAAHTIRRKLYKLLPEYLDNFIDLKKQNDSQNLKYGEKFLFKNIDWEKVLPSEKREKLDWITAGEDEAEKSLKKFLKGALNEYAYNRNDPNKNGQSNLSPFLHYGMISAQKIALDVVDMVEESITKILSDSKNRAKNNLPPEEMTLLDHAGAFLEELIIRKELSDNFCYYNKNYDNPACFSVWASNSLHEHVSDKREYIYTLDEFEKAETHDDLWNAAQMEMVNKGKMHGYMRMYWAKKILEWTENPADAMDIAIYLNDKYELDGRDPNGYAGIAWSIGGVHDRPWFNRPVFGQIRYMNRGGCEKKFDVEEYIKKNLSNQLF